MLVTCVASLVMSIISSAGVFEEYWTESHISKSRVVFTGTRPATDIREQ